MKSGNTTSSRDQRRLISFNKPSMMKTLLLLLLPLMTDCEDVSELSGCSDGWIDFTCRYPDRNQKYSRVHVVKDKEKIITSSEINKWEHEDRVHVYHDTNNKKLRVVIRPLKTKDSGKYKCKFKEWKKNSDSSEEKMNPKVTLRVVAPPAESCQDGVSQTAYRSAQTSISCLSGGNRDMFFCRDDGSICEDISSNGTFTVSASSSSFSMSISAVSSQHAGVYWCGLGAAGGRYRAALRRITLEVKVPLTTPSSTSSAPPRPVTPSFSSPAESEGGSWVPVLIFSPVCLVFLGLISVFGYKRFQHSRTKSVGEEPNQEDRAYEEIQERPYRPNTGTAIQTIYATASAPTIPSGSQDYSTIEAPNRSGETFSTVKDGNAVDSFYSSITDRQQL